MVFLWCLCFLCFLASCIPAFSEVTFWVCVIGATCACAITIGTTPTWATTIAMASALRRFELSIISLHIERGYVLMAFTTVPAGQAGLLAIYDSSSGYCNNLSELTVPTNGQRVDIAVPVSWQVPEYMKCLLSFP